jgi:hypothetical protein
VEGHRQICVADEVGCRVVADGEVFDSRPVKAREAARSICGRS